MVDYENTRRVVAAGLKNYLDCPIIRSNQIADPPSYPYVSYTITTIQSENKGTFGVYEDEIDRKPVIQTWSISVLSDDDNECVNLAMKAHEWLEHVGTTYLNDNHVIVQGLSAITNRDNILSNGYEYKKGFDVQFWLFDEITNPILESGRIESVENSIIEE